MDAPTGRPHGPIGAFRHSRRFRYTVIAFFALGPLLYILSSGPMITATWRGQTSFVDSSGPAGAVTATKTIMIPDVWMKFYAPLWWASQQPWGEGVFGAYWGLFPIPERPADMGNDLMPPKPVNAGD